MILENDKVLFSFELYRSSLRVAVSRRARLRSVGHCNVDYVCSRATRNLPVSGITRHDYNFGYLVNSFKFNEGWFNEDIPLM